MIRRYKEIMESAIANMVAKQDKITDFNEGSIAHTVLDTFSRLLERAYVSIRQGYTEALRLIPFMLFGFKRKEGSYATGSIIFKRTEAFEKATLISKGVKVSCDGLVYQTTKAGTIEPGNILSSPIPIIAEKPGVNYNVAAGMVTVIDSAIPGEVVECYNEVALTGGADAETTAEVDERFKAKINSYAGTSTWAIKSATLELDCVRSCAIQEHAPPLKDVYNLTIYVEDGSGAASNEVIEKVKKEIEGDSNTCGHLAPGINIRVKAPKVVPVDFDVTATVYRTDRDFAQSEISKVIAEYTNGLIIGKPVIISELINRIISIKYVHDVTVNSPAMNVEPTSEGICRFNSAVVDVAEDRS